jgi:acylphosphatase
MIRPRWAVAAHKEQIMKWGFRVPSFRKRIAARTSAKRIIRNLLGLKAPRGWGWLTNPKKAAYNRVYNRTTFGLGKGCLVVVLMVLVPAVLLLHPGCKGQKPPSTEPSTRPIHAGKIAASAPSTRTAAPTASSPASTQAAHRRIHVFITGRVQGVGFRAFTEEQAQRLKVAGFVRNLDDGRVEMVAEGPPADIDKLIAQVKHGPASAQVDKLDCTEETPKGEFKGFRIK